jgi:protein involved in polysaccharide export with SLBB domain
MVSGGHTELKVLAFARGRQRLLPFALVVFLLFTASCALSQDVTVSGTPQQANDRIKAMSQTSKPSTHEYTIGSGDLLDISVFDVPELTREVRVNQSGTISIPLVPARLHVAGLTEMQAEQKIADVLEANGLVSHPEVGVNVKEHRSRPITIVGAVQHPMVYEADRGVTLLEVLAEAGGIAADAGDTIIVTRPRAAVFIPVTNPEAIAESAPGAASADNPSSTNASPPNDEDKEKHPSDDKSANSSVPPAFPSAAQLPQAPASAAPSTEPPASSLPSNIITINLNDLLESGDMRNNIPLQAGDVVTVPHAGIVYVLGAVVRPGGFVLSNDRTQLTTLKILSLAGGLNKTAKLDHAVIIRKDNQGKQTQTEVDLKKIIARQSEDLQMRASDILYVPDSKTKEVLYTALQIMTAVGTSVAIYRVAYQ